MIASEQTLRGAAPVLDTMSFGDLLRRRRLAAMLSQEELAERAGLSPRGISDLERGARRAPHLATVRLLAAALALNTVDQQSLVTAARPARQTNISVAPVPAPRTSPIGWESELAELSSLLARVAERLVTLTGPASVGKPRFGLALGAGLRVEVGDAVVFVAFATVQEPAIVAAAIPPSDRRAMPVALGSHGKECRVESTNGSTSPRMG